jgi:DNA-binding response OmpR family regulator
MKILVVDDDQTLRDVLESLLVSEGHQVCLAPSLQTAESTLATESFDLVLTDAFAVRWCTAGLPHIRQLAKSVHPTPVVLMTTLAPGSPIDVAEHGLADWISKPFSLDDLLAQLDRAARFPS